MGELSGSAEAVELLPVPAADAEAAGVEEELDEHAVKGTISMIAARARAKMRFFMEHPHFLSWAVIGGILVNFLSPTWGVVNQIIQQLGFDPIFFLGDPKYFRTTAVISSIWKEAGWGTIIYLAAITGIDVEQYEAATVDGANRWQRLIHITLPNIKTTVILMLILRMGSIMSNGFEQIYTLQNTQNLAVSEVFETYTYRVGLLGGRFSFATTVGLFASVISMIFLLTTNFISKKMGEETIF